MDWGAAAPVGAAGLVFELLIVPREITWTAAQTAPNAEDRLMLGSDWPVCPLAGR